MNDMTADNPCLPRLAIVDDDEALISTMTDMLADEYIVQSGPDTQSGWADLLEADVPDVILLDIAMPQVSGYQLCRSIRANPLLDFTPVIFMSGVVNLDEHLTADDAGGTDFVAKPFRVAELKQKIAIARRYAEGQRLLKLEAKSAFSTAMTAMSSAAEMGIVLQFVQRSYEQATYDALAACLAESCAAFGLNACIQLRGERGVLNRGLGGEATPLELSILGQIAGCGRIVDFRNRSAFNYPHATLMIVDMPVDDLERYGRLRDHLVVLAEAASARIQALDNAIQSEKQARLLTEVVDQTRKTLSDINELHRSGRLKAADILHQMLDQVERSFVHLGLSEQQESALSENLRTAVHDTIDLFDHGLAIDSHLHAVTETLRFATQRESHGARIA